MFQRPGKIIRMDLPPTRLEILTSIDGVEFEDCYPERIEDTLDGVEVRVIDRQNLLLNKAASGRHRDLADLESLGSSYSTDK